MRECLHTLTEAFAVCHPAHMWQLSETYAATEISKSRWFRGLERRFEPVLGGGLLRLPRPGCFTPPGAAALRELCLVDVGPGSIKEQILFYGVLAAPTLMR